MHYKFLGFPVYGNPKNVGLFYNDPNSVQIEDLEIGIIGIAFPVGADPHGGKVGSGLIIG